MKPRFISRKALFRWISLGIALALLAWPGFGFTPPAAAQSPEPPQLIVIDSPPAPPAVAGRPRAAIPLADSAQASAAVTLPVPAYTWELGCSPVAAAMIAGYYDRGAFPQIYTGPANGGVMPMDGSAWPAWSDGSQSYPNNPLIASRSGVDGRTQRGTIEDYWVKSNSTSPDPFLSGGWAQHAWGTAIGDYMKTSQSQFGNGDGSTHFYANPSGAPLTCASMQSQGIQDDGTLGRKQFYEARGYAVSDCYNQNTDNNGGGFGFSQYQAEINAGNPVLLNLAGHSIVGLGYDAASRTVYLHDTWDRSTYGMPWGGDYLNMTLLSVSIVHIASPGLPGVFSESVPSNGASGQPTSLTLRWGASSQAAGYEVCYDQTSDNACTNWIDTGTATQLTVSGLTTGASYTWQVRARNASGVTYANNAAWWRFQTRSTAAAGANRLFIPQISR